MPTSGQSGPTLAIPDSEAGGEFSDLMQMFGEIVRFPPRSIGIPAGMCDGASRVHRVNLRDVCLSCRDDVCWQEPERTKMILGRVASISFDEAKTNHRLKIKSA